MSVRGRVVIACRIVVLGACAVMMVDGRHPPAHGQSNQMPQLPAQSEATAIAVQGVQISQVDKTAEANRGDIKDLKKDIGDLKEELAGSHQESRIVSGIIALVTAIQLILGRKKKGDDDDA